jgi:hypothetical protein
MTNTTDLWVVDSKGDFRIAVRGGKTRGMGSGNGNELEGGSMPENKKDNEG